MFYLYIKTHNKTGLKYLGKTNRDDYHVYPGSGVRWKRHLAKHGYDYATTILLVTDNKEELRETGLFFSKLFNVVKSKEWANFQDEKGDGVSSEFATEENHRRINAGTHQFCNPLHNQRTNAKRQATMKKNGSHNFRGGEMQKKRVEAGTHHLLSGEIQRTAQRKLAAAGLHHLQNYVRVVDAHGTIKRVLRQEYDPTSTVLVHVNSLEGKRRLGKSTEPTDKQKAYLNAKLECPYCKKVGNVSNMKKWHFENCKGRTTA